MQPTEVVGTPDQIHAGSQHGFLVGESMSAAHQWRQGTAKGSIEPLDVGSIDAGSPPLVASLATMAFAVPRTTRRSTLTTRRRTYRLTTWPRSNPLSSTSRGRPRRPVRTGCRNTRRTAVI